MSIGIAHQRSVKACSTSSAVPDGQVTCPPWCTVGPDEHLADLVDNEGRCLHASDYTAEGWCVYATTTVDGRPRPFPGEQPVGIHLSGYDEATITVDEAERRIEALLELVRTARA